MSSPQPDLHNPTGIWRHRAGTQIKKKRLYLDPPGTVPAGLQTQCPGMKLIKMDQHQNAFRMEGSCCPGVWDTLWNTGAESNLGLQKTFYRVLEKAPEMEKWMDLGDFKWTAVVKTGRQRNIKDWSHVTSLLFGILVWLHRPWLLIKFISNFYAGWGILFIMYMHVYRDLSASTGLRAWVGVSRTHGVSAGVQGNMQVQERPELNQLVRRWTSLGARVISRIQGSQLLETRAKNTYTFSPSAGKGRSVQPLLMPGNTLLALLQVRPPQAVASPISGCWWCIFP